MPKGSPVTSRSWRKLLAADEPDGDKIQPWLEKIGEATAKAVERAEDEKVADQIRKLARRMGAKAAA